MYTESENYSRVLGAQLTRVFTADMEGMHYMSAQPINGYTIYFGARGKDISIRFKQGSQVWELVSHRVFYKDLRPHSLRTIHIGSIWRMAGLNSGLKIILGSPSRIIGGLCGARSQSQSWYKATGSWWMYEAELLL